MARYDLSEAEWRLIGPLLPNKPRGVPGWMTVVEVGAAALRSPTLSKAPIQRSKALIRARSVRGCSRGKRVMCGGPLGRRPTVWPYRAIGGPVSWSAGGPN